MTIVSEAEHVHGFMINIKLTINRMKHIVSSSLYLEAGPVPEVLWLVCFILFLVEVVLIINTCTCYVSFTIVIKILLNICLVLALKCARNYLII